MIRHHVEEEESEMFPEARALLGHDALERLGEQIAAAKRKALGKSAGSKPAMKAKPAKPARARAHAPRAKSARGKQG
jgi:hypothetical protein